MKIKLLSLLMFLSVISKAGNPEDPIKHYKKSDKIEYKSWGKTKVLGADSSIVSKAEIDNLRNIKTNQSKVITKVMKDGSLLTINSLNKDGKIIYGGSISTVKGDSAIEILSSNGRDFTLNKKSKSQVRFIRTE